MTVSSIYTIGYEGKSVEEVMEQLTEAGIELLVDVRWRPNSRKRGLSKTPLSQQCDEHGIAYLHDRQLGTPPEILDEYKQTGFYDWDAYEDFLDEQVESLSALTEQAGAKRACLLCYEADAGECHRRFVADRVATALEVDIVNI